MSRKQSTDKVPGKKRIMILGGGPNRIGQGIEFDYCCCHASFALRELGIESIMVNSNPETVSTDYDTSDLLFFEPLTNEDVLNICDRVQPDGVIVQFGGQTPLNLARGLASAGVPIIGTSVDTIEAAEDREKFQLLLRELGIKQPGNAIACATMAQARVEVQKVGYPALVRPSYVLGGRAMEICYDNSQFERYVAEAFVVAQGQPVLIDSFLEDAIEVDVDALCDGNNVVVMGIMEHIEEAGVHSGDSACVIPLTVAVRRSRNPRSDCGNGQTPAHDRLDERPVRRKVRRGRDECVCPRSQSTSEPYCSVCRQSDRGACCETGGQSDDGFNIGGSRCNKRAGTRECRSRKAFFVPQVCWRRYRAWPRNRRARVK